MTTATGARIGRGMVLEGKFMEARQEKDRTVGDKTYPGRYKVSIFAKGRLYEVEFRDEAEANDRIGPAQEGDYVEAVIGTRSAKGFTFYYSVA